ncbi:hypothetical protein H3S88_12965 [Gilliamella sp. B14448G11]|uniref:hypothetical protein n=1 Tax=unclassified Gilliamella TaxID=2685620 RepID=UPI0018DB2F27|nr:MULTISPECIES: hypothetical protein [unclassified Gilliamella]MBI0029579.1 hypothetical protein [Gilliamella sp. B14448G7]MBI0036571.1 hypothetical protein [Gilliamella sp. B14448G11]MBI0043728.1 hypothetical protein [Gilliamella sp. B14448G12]
MNIVKSILMIVFLIPQVTEAVYRVYSGNIGDDKVEFYLLATPDSNFDITYIKDKTYEVGYIGGPQKKENDYHFKNFTTIDTDNDSDTLIIKNFDFSLNKVKSESNYLFGYSEKFGDFKLKKEFEYNVFTANGYELTRVESKQLFDNTEFNNIEFLQRSSTKDFYFKVILSKKKKEEIKITGINVYSKKNGELLQTIKNSKGYVFYTFHAIQIGDFDFDGNENDFFLQGAESHAANVPQIYYVYDDSQNKYIEANLEGYSIQFDSENKTATSTKTCGDVITYTSNVLLKKLYYFNNKEKKYTYIDKYCAAIPDGDNYYLRQCTKKERLDCEKAVVEVGDEP